MHDPEAESGGHAMYLSQQQGFARRMMIAFCTIAFTEAATPALAQRPAEPVPTTPAAQTAPPAAPQPSPPKSYAPLAVRPPQPAADPTFETFRKQLADVVRRKDRAALQRLVVSQGFFWEAETGDKANKRKSSFENFATAIGLNDKSGSGWEIIAAAAAEPSLEAMENRKGVMCGPASPQIDEDKFEALIKATATGAEEWGFPHAAGLEVRAAPKPNAPVIETLGMHLIRVMPDDDNSSSSQPPEMMRVVGPSGKIGYVPVDSLLPVVFDQLCYSKDSGDWKIAGYSGGE
jgi:hypothetical protein